MAEPLTVRQLADLLAAHLGRPVQVRVSRPGTVRLLGLAAPMLGEVAALAYQWQQPFRTDHGDFDAAFPGAVRPTAQGDAVAAAWFDNRQETAR